MNYIVVHRLVKPGNVIFDIDDTLISSDRSHRTIEPIARLYRHMRAKKQPIYYVTARPLSVSNLYATKKQLNHHGFHVRSTNGLFLQPSNIRSSCRFKMRTRNYIAQQTKKSCRLIVGDAFHDLFTCAQMSNQYNTKNYDDDSIYVFITSTSVRLKLPREGG